MKPWCGGGGGGAGGDAGSAGRSDATRVLALRRPAQLPGAAGSGRGGSAGAAEGTPPVRPPWGALFQGEHRFQQLQELMQILRHHMHMHAGTGKAMC